MQQTTFEDIFKAAAVDGFVHARDLGSGGEIGYRADTAVVAASVFKVPVLVELFRQSDAGLVDLTEPVTVPVAGRAPGPTGLSVMLGPVTLSWRDLALSMMVVSDNAATDVICAKVGLSKVNATMRALGLPGTAVDFDCRGLFAQMGQDAGVANLADFPTHPDAELVRRLRVLDAPKTNRTTPREISSLFEMIWADRAASPDSCAQMRRILGAQVWPHRLASGFPEDHIKTAGKTGTLVIVRNEAGMVSYGNGRNIAVSVFTRSHEVRIKHPAQDAAIGKAAHLAVDMLAAQDTAG
ncbi:MAG: serine hydrolase [Stenotrophobium sp.]